MNCDKNLSADELAKVNAAFPRTQFSEKQMHSANVVYWFYDKDNIIVTQFNGRANVEGVISSTKDNPFRVKFNGIIFFVGSPPRFYRWRISKEWSATDRRGAIRPQEG